MTVWGRRKGWVCRSRVHVCRILKNIPHRQSSFSYVGQTSRSSTFFSILEGRVQKRRVDSQRPFSDGGSATQNRRRLLVLLGASGRASGGRCAKPWQGRPAVWCITTSWTNAARPFRGRCRASPQNSCAGSVRSVQGRCKARTNSAIFG